MKIFIAGATGVLGKRVTPQLVAAGHQVVGLSRSSENDAWLTSQRAIARRGDLFDAAQMQAVTADCDAILHLATAIPTKSRTTRKDWQLNDRIRREGTRNLLAAAVRNHTQLYLQQSVTFLYGDQSGAWVDEKTPLPACQVSTIQSAAAMEQMVQEATVQHGLPSAILRFGTFYSHDSVHSQAMFAAIQKGFFPIIGKGDAYWNMIHIDDAAAAIVKLVSTYQLGQPNLYNVVDDEPVTYQNLVEAMAAQLGARKPMHIPVWLGRLAVGSHLVDNLLASVRCHNQRIKEATGWQPRYPSYREGMSAAITAWQAQMTQPKPHSTPLVNNA